LFELGVTFGEIPKRLSAKFAIFCENMHKIITKHIAIFYAFTKEQRVNFVALSENIHTEYPVISTD